MKTLASIEKMGCITDICTEKTGILTLNRLAVTRIYAGRSVDINLDLNLNNELVALNLSNLFNPAFD